jgi:hypothetical protein
MAYKLELPPSSCVHLVFHISSLNKVIDNKISVQTVLLEINEEGEIILEPKNPTGHTDHTEVGGGGWGESV